MAVSEGLYQRMLKKIQKSESGCWLWAGATTNGYGTQALPGYGPNRRAHVLMYEHHFGPVSEGMVVCHKCNVKLCVRPDHLYAGTQGQNVQQAAADGLLPKGSNHPKSKLSEQDVATIRELMDGFPPGGRRAIELAKQFGVSRTNIRLIATNQIWKG